MKNFLLSKSGKILMAILGGVAIAGVTVAVIFGFHQGFRTILVEETLGTVTVANEETGILAAYEGMHLESGDEVTVGEESRLTMRLDMDKYVTADANTHFWVEASGDGERKSNMRTYIYMDSGSILNRLDEKLEKDETYEVQTPNSTISVRGTTFRVTVYEDEVSQNYTHIECLSGVVKVDLKTEDGKLTGETKNVEAGESATVLSDDKVSEFVEVIQSKDEETNTNVTEVKIEDITEHVEGEWTVIKEATCEEKGITVLSCAECEMILEEKEIPMLEHSYEEKTISETAGCVTTITKFNVCSLCQAEVQLGKTQTQNHIYEEKEVSETVGCVTTTTVYKACSKCQKEDGNKSTGETINHSFGEWTTEIEASCSAEGVLISVCTVCGEQQTQSIAKLEHVADPEAIIWEIVKSPTCQEMGTQRKPCKNCDGYIYREISGSHTFSYTANGHDLSGVNYNYLDGYQICDVTTTCNICGTSDVETHNLKVDNITNSDGTTGTRLKCYTCGITW